MKPLYDLQAELHISSLDFLRQLCTIRAIHGSPNRALMSLQNDLSVILAFVWYANLNAFIYLDGTPVHFKVWEHHVKKGIVIYRSVDQSHMYLELPPYVKFQRKRTDGLGGCRFGNNLARVLWSAGVGTLICKQLIQLEISMWWGELCILGIPRIPGEPLNALWIPQSNLKIQALLF